MTSKPDIDIEVKNRDKVLLLISHICASQISNNQLVKHNTGVYLQKIPKNPINDLAVFPYDIAEDLDYNKIDLLSCPYPYDNISSMEELHSLLREPIDWNWFTNVEFVANLFHCGGRVNKDLTVADVISHYSPQSIEDIACLIAIKLPAKRHLIGESWEKIRKEIWLKDPEKRPQFRKSHGLAYALVVGLDARIKAKEMIS